MITTLVMENFLPFRDRVELPMANQGLVLVRGANRVSQAADSNGAGKTSIGHAVCWALFGEDLKGRRADAVACRHTEGTCRVRLDMQDALGSWTIARTRRPAALTVAGIPGIGENEDMALIQQKIEQRLGFGVRTFKNAVVFGQGAFERFSQADQGEQMRMLDEIQGLDFSAALARTKDWRDSLAAERSKADDDLRVMEVQAESLRRQIEGLEELRDSFGASKRDDVRMLEARRPELVRRLSDASDRETAMELDRRKLAALVVHDKAICAAAEGANALRAAADTLQDSLDSIVGRREDVQAALSVLFSEGICPDCRRPVKSKADRAAIKKLFDPEIARLAKEITSADKVHQKARSAALDADARVVAAQDQVEKEYPGAEAVLGRTIAYLQERTSARMVKALVEAKASIVRDMEALDLQIKNALSRKWDGEEGLQSARVKIEEISDLRQMASTRIGKLMVAVRIAEYWYEAFGDRGIRSLLVDGVSDFINERLAFHLAELTCGEAAVRMSAQTALKKGGSRERISFSTEWAWGGAGENDGSGGQDQRKHLAVFAAIQDLAEARSARPFPLKMWDEPGDNLDARGQEMFLRWVEREARRRGTGLLVTHSEAMAAEVEADQVWTVVLDVGGAHVER